MTGLELGTFCLREHVSGKKSLTTKLRACQVTRNLMIVRSFLPSLIICRSLGLSLVTKINYQSKGNVGIMEINGELFIKTLNLSVSLKTDDITSS